MKSWALNVDFNGVRFDPLGSRSPPYRCIKFGYPLEKVQFLLLSTNLAREWLQIDTDLLLIITSTANELSTGTNMMTLNNLEPPKQGVLVNFQLFQAAIHILRLNCAETVHDRPGQPAYEMFGIKRRFQQCKVYPLSSRSPPYERIKFGYPLENVRFLLLSTNLAREWLPIYTDLLLIITTTADELSVGTNIDDLERP